MERENRTEQGRCWPAIMVAGNKCDLQSMRQVGASEGLDWAKSRGCGFMETSAREVVNIEETFAGTLHQLITSRTSQQLISLRYSYRQTSRRSQKTTRSRPTPTLPLPNRTTTKPPASLGDRDTNLRSSTKHHGRIGKAALF